MEKQKLTYRPMERNGEPGVKPLALWAAGVQQGPGALHGKDSLFLEAHGAQWNRTPPLHRSQQST